LNCAARRGSKPTRVYRKRVVAASVAAALGALAPEEPLFLPYPSWRQQQKKRDRARKAKPSPPEDRTAVLVAVLDDLSDSGASGQARGAASDVGGEP
jgi:hypothetical protein